MTSSKVAPKRYYSRFTANSISFKTTELSIYTVTPFLKTGETMLKYCEKKGYMRMLKICFDSGILNKLKSWHLVCTYDFSTLYSLYYDA